MKTFNEILDFINSEIEQLDFNKKPLGLYDPIDYTLSLGGKRIRPVLTLMACNLFSTQPKEAIHPALGIEVFHNFTLLHDDIMDHADVRRGKPTVHKKWNENTAILSGDVMLILAYEEIAKSPSYCLKEVLDLFSTTAKEICEGQQYDMEFEEQSSVTPEEYIEMIRLKTAVLLGCSLKTGALVGHATKKNAELLYNFGINIGLAFQLQDDILDVYGNEETFGKKIGGDILCNKKTYLLIHALKLADAPTLKELQEWLNKKEFNEKDKIKAVTTIYNQLNVKKICKDKMNFYYDRAISELDLVEIEAHKKQGLRKLAQNLMLRKE